MAPEQAPATPPEAVEKVAAAALDNGTQVLELAARGVGALWDGVCAVGAACEAAGSVIPGLD